MPGSRVNLLKLLIGVMLLYVPVQWVAGRHPGSTAIFNAHRGSTRHDFLQAASALGKQLVSGCSDGSIDTIYFYDSDVLSPYFLNELKNAPGCRVIRETDVTPVDDEARLGCGRVIVDESLLSAWLPGHFADNIGPLQGKVSVIDSWSSSSGEYGWKLLEANGCPGLQGNTP